MRKLSEVDQMCRMADKTIADLQSLETMLRKRHVTPMGAAAVISAVQLRAVLELAAKDGGL